MKKLHFVLMLSAVLLVAPSCEGLQPDDLKKYLEDMTGDENGTDQEKIKLLKTVSYSQSNGEWGNPDIMLTYDEDNRISSVHYYYEEAEDSEESSYAQDMLFTYRVNEVVMNNNEYKLVSIFDGTKLLSQVDDDMSRAFQS